MATNTMSEHEAFIQQAVERALEPYKNIAPPSMLVMLRRAAEQYWRTHPKAVAIAHTLTRATPQVSGSIATEDRAESAGAREDRRDSSIQVKKS